MAKGAGLEELVRAYFARQGFVALRSVSLQFEDDEVTDVDVWLYGRQGAGVRTRGLVDVKDKKTPKAFERIMWARGMQLALNCDRAFVTTTVASPKIVRFAHQQKVALLTSGFLRNWANGEDVLKERLSLEELSANIQEYSGHKQDGDWLKQIASAKSAVISLAPFPAFNKAVSCFRFFADRAATRPQHREQALRGAYLSAALACMALDAAMEKLTYEQPAARYDLLYSGVTYGDAGDGKVLGSVDAVLSVISRGLSNGRALARQAKDALDEMFASVRADIIAEFFAKEHNSAHLYSVAWELEGRAHARSRDSLVNLSTEAKSIIGVLADFVGAKRTALFSGSFVATAQTSPIPNLSSAKSNDIQPTGVLSDSVGGIVTGDAAQASIEEEGKSRGSSPTLL